MSKWHGCPTVKCINDLCDSGCLRLKSAEIKTPPDDPQPSYDSRYLHGGQRSTYQRLNFGELA